LESLFDYLYTYLARVKPLLDINNEIDIAARDFEKKWTDGTFPGWPVRSHFLFCFKYFD
jgi:splicing factor 3A subunit 3